MSDNNTNAEYELCKKYFERFDSYAFNNKNHKQYDQYVAMITRYYHILEKGMSFLNYRPWFGRDNVKNLIQIMKEYAMEFDVNDIFYKNALCTLYKYIEKSQKYGGSNEELEKLIYDLKGNPDGNGGTISFTPNLEYQKQKIDYEEFIASRHSLRHFSDVPVNIEVIKKAIELAQKTPSACNRQGWKIYIADEKDKKMQVLSNQNGSAGFADEIDKLILITFDLKYSNRDREVFQGFIDGGMFGANLLNALHYYGLATIPLSASLTASQEENVRKICNLSASEVLILFIGIGNYPDDCQSTVSARRKPNITII